MKFLESSRFEAINAEMFLDCQQAQIVGRIESYSCKMIGTEKALFKKFNGQIGRKPNELEALSPPHRGYGGYEYVGGRSQEQNANETIGFSRSLPASYSSPPASFGRREHIAEIRTPNKNEPLMVETMPRRTLFYLISTLNSAFPDYDFSDAKSDEFIREPSLQYVTSNVDSLMSAATTSQYARVRDELWSAMNDEITFSQCLIYSYNPDLASDPFGEDGCLWSFNYFFYNQRMRRIVLFHCRCLSPFSSDYQTLRSAPKRRVATDAASEQADIMLEEGDARRDAADGASNGDTDSSDDDENDDYVATIASSIRPLVAIRPPDVAVAHKRVRSRTIGDSSSCFGRSRSPATARCMVGLRSHRVRRKSARLSDGSISSAGSSLNSPPVSYHRDVRL